MATWWVEVEGFVLPKPISGHPGLELCNTRAGWDEPPGKRKEYLRSYAHLVVLAAETGLIARDRAAELRGRASPGTDETPTMRRELLRARDLRADAHAVITGAGTAAASKRLARSITVAHGRQRLCVGASGARWVWPAPARITEPLDALLLAVADLLISDALPRVHPCPGAGCGWLFVDPSGRRRWCQMEVCGNRAKQVRVRQRQARSSVGGRSRSTDPSDTR